MMKRILDTIHSVADRGIDKIEKIIANKLLISNKNCFGDLMKYKTSSIFDSPKADFIYRESTGKCIYNVVSKPRTYPDFKEERMDIACFPDYISAFNNAKVLPGTDAIIKDTAVLSDRFAYDKDASVVLGVRMLKSFDKENVVLRVKKTERLKGTYIDLCYCGGGNIWHMSYDMLSKFRLINSCDSIKNIPILMDEGIKTNRFARHYIDCFDQHKHRIIYLKSDRLYDVEKVYTVSLSYIFMRSKKQCEDMFFISNKFTVFARDIMRNKLHASKTRRFFIQRGDKRLVNEEEVASYLRNKGFEVIRPEKFSLIDELSLFYDAECVVGAIGAAFTNSLYVKNKCNLICIAPKERIGLVNSYATITKGIGAKVYYCRAETVSNDGTGTQGLKFRANMSELEKIYDYLFSCCVQ
ncbi:MAG: glycosyltransferase family 61 protein [Lachnospiraceae bacterium]|nr:glycosyltransferase family 61 protein [Lachnospiraceae bacterium]